MEALWNIGHDSPNWVFPDLDREVEEGGSIHGPAMMHFLSSIKVGSSICSSLTRSLRRTP